MDSYAMAGERRYEGLDRTVLQPATAPEKTPLRSLYLAKQDDLIYSAVTNYFMAVQATLWVSATQDSYIRKTVGIQALFDLARPLFFQATEEKDLRADRFQVIMARASRVNFADNFFQASGTGRQRIRTCLAYCVGLVKLEELKPADLEQVRRLCG